MGLRHDELFGYDKPSQKSFGLKLGVESVVHLSIFFRLDLQHIGVYLFLVLRLFRVVLVFDSVGVLPPSFVQLPSDGIHPVVVCFGLVLHPFPNEQVPSLVECV